MADHPLAGFSPEQQELWQRVNELWSLSLERDAERIRGNRPLSTVLPGAGCSGSHGLGLIR